MRHNQLFNAHVRTTKDETFEAVLRDMNIKHQMDCPLYILDIGDIIHKIKNWRLMMPRVKIFYAVKCNNHPYVLKLLDALGTGFDCASKNEIKVIRDMGVEPSRIIYAHPSKPMSHIESANAQGVDLMTFDSKSELEKSKLVCPKARLVLRIRCDAEVAQCPLGMKFGVLPDQAHALLKLAKELHLNVVGVSFHVGSGCQESAVFLRAIKEARDVFNLAKTYGFDFKLLDIGGGFPGTGGNTLDELANYINKGLNQYFPDENDVEVIAEPGRYVVASAFTLLTKVLSTQCANVAEDTEPFGYFLNDGVYGSFNCVLYDHQVVEPQVLEDENALEEPLYSSMIWGPTCDSFDLIMKEVKLPKLVPGDTIYWRDMGAYTLVAASTFNGFPVPEVQMIVPSHMWLYVEQLIESAANAKLDSSRDEPCSAPAVVHEKPYKPFFLTHVLEEKIPTTLTITRTNDGPDI